MLETPSMLGDTQAPHLLVATLSTAQAGSGWKLSPFNGLAVANGDAMCLATGFGPTAGPI